MSFCKEFGLVEWQKQTGGSYKSGKGRLLILLPIIKNNVKRGLIIWVDEWRIYRRIGSEYDKVLYESVNFVRKLYSFKSWLYSKNRRHFECPFRKSCARIDVALQQKKESLLDNFEAFYDEIASRHPINWRLNFP
ncbi:hypothetical protein HZS_263 [Henneguya salminicola]|nr:hypothetical protein HZS_263 [Henneguya salminicola]